MISFTGLQADAIGGVLPDYPIAWLRLQERFPEI